MRWQSIWNLAAAGTLAVTVMAAPGLMKAQGADTVLKAADTQKMLPASYYRGQSAPTQLRNSGGVKFGDGFFVLTTMVDNSGYASDVQAKYQAYFVTEVPIKIGGENLAAGIYGIGFVKDNKFVVDRCGRARGAVGGYGRRCRTQTAYAAASRGRPGRWFQTLRRAPLCEFQPLEASARGRIARLRARLSQRLFFPIYGCFELGGLELDELAAESPRRCDVDAGLCFRDHSVVDLHFRRLPQHEDALDGFAARGNQNPLRGGVRFGPHRDRHLCRDVAVIGHVDGHQPVTRRGHGWEGAFDAQVRQPLVGIDPLGKKTGKIAAGPGLFKECFKGAVGVVFSNVLAGNILGGIVGPQSG